jgi:ParB family chromosome partitioning protein
MGMSDMSSGGSNKRRGLGRGLGALIVDTQSARAEDVSSTDTGTVAGVLQLPVEAISPNPQQPRTTFEPAALEELAASIREHGILQPLIVTREVTREAQQAERYWLVTGERRWRAARLAALDSVPAIVREVSPQQLLELALVENLQRADLNPLEEAAAYQTLTNEFSLTQAEIGQRVGKSRSAVANTLRLLQLPLPAQQALTEQRISAGHARALLALSDQAAISAVLERILARDLTVRQTEEMVRQILLAPQLREAQPELPDQTTHTHVAYLENRFRTALGTRVNLNRNADGSGRLIVHFYSDEDLDKLVRFIAPDDGLGDDV